MRYPTWHMQRTLHPDQSVLSDRVRRRLEEMFVKEAQRDHGVAVTRPCTTVYVCDDPSKILVGMADEDSNVETDPLRVDISAIPVQ